MIKKLYALLVIVLFITPFSFGQSQRGEIRGVVRDSKTKQPIDFVPIAAQLNGFQAGSAMTDLDGKYSISALTPGKYTVIVRYVGYNEVIIDNVMVRPDQITFLDVDMDVQTTELKTVVKREYKNPIIRADDNGKTLDGDQIKKVPTRSTNAIANMGSGVFSLDGGTPSFRGARASGTAYYINGVRVIGSVGIPQNGIGQTNVITGGIPAEYGDFTGGAISITTPPPSTRFRGGVELVTSSLFDKYHYNHVETYFTGPLYVKNRGKETERAVLGYLFAGNFRYIADGGPSSIGVWQMKPSALKELEETPLRPSPIGQGFVPSAEFVTMEDMEKVQAKQNIPSYNISAVANLTYAPNDRISILLGGTYNYFNDREYSFSNSLFNSNNNQKQLQHSMLTYLTFTQKLVNPVAPGEVSKNRLIEKAYYSVSLQYQSTWFTAMDAVHKDNIFDYGYVGRFKTYSMETYDYRSGGDGPNGSGGDLYVINGDSVWLKNYFKQTGYGDTLYTFDRTPTKNPILANYTSNYYDYVDGNVLSFSQLRGSNSGLTNGQSPIGIYSNMWVNVGTVVSGYQKSQAEQYSLNAVGEASMKGHDLKFGIYYEQQVRRGYGLGASGLWQLAWQLSARMSNGMLLDESNPLLQYDENGVFTNVVNFNAVVDEKTQSTFDKNFRKYLIENGKRDNYGNLVDGSTLIDVNSYDPSDFKLEFFSADELFNNGGNKALVSYYGYDYLGNKVRGKKSIESFTDDPLNRSIGAFMPIYTAAFIQDKFAFKDLIFRVGVRIERYDANQPVLKDPYSLYPIKTVGEVKEINGATVNHPDGVEDDFYVYVNSVKNPQNILGYRDGNIWYNKEGLQIQDPAIVAKTASGIIQPYLVDPEREVVSGASFKSYDPQINVLPRVWFDFPISSEARFFANYDVIAQRPDLGASFAPIDQFYYLRANPTLVVANPDLKPQITTDYEIGFKQKLSNNSGLSLIANYREQRNLIQQFRFNYAYPVSYTSYANIDFATIKGFRVEYELRDAGNLNMDANYTLQYADGTGSGTNSQQALVSAGLPNLRNLFPLNVDIRHNIKLNLFYDYGNGKEYNGPVVKGKRIFENAGVGMLLNAFSGIPYTANLIPTPRVQSGIVVRSPIKGTPFGSRLPWQLQNDIQIYKGYNVKLGKNKDGQVKYGQLRFTLWVQNFLDLRNIRSVHPYTGSPDTDGYLNSPNGQSAIEQSVNQQAFVDLYNTALANPGYYGLPRRIRLNIKLDF